MKRTFAVLLCILAVSTLALAQEEGDRTRLLYGPRVGATYIMTSKDTFTGDMRHIFGGSKSYFPVFTELGLSATHLIPLGDTEAQFSVEETLLLGGLDQQILLPSVKVLLGARTGFGGGLSVGPFVSTGRAADGVELRFSLAYAVSWSFTFREITIPVSFTFVPWPGYAKPRMTLTSGVDFAVVD